MLQSEGTVTARFRGTGLTISPVISIGQNYSLESLAFFVRLYHELGKIGRISVVETLSGKPRAGSRGLH